MTQTNLFTTACSNHSQQLSLNLKQKTNTKFEESIGLVKWQYSCTQCSLQELHPQLRPNWKLQNPDDPNQSLHHNLHRNQQLNLNLN